MFYFNFYTFLKLVVLNPHTPYFTLSEVVKEPQSREKIPSSLQLRENKIIIIGNYQSIFDKLSQFDNKFSTPSVKLQPTPLESWIQPVKVTLGICAFDVERALTIWINHHHHLQGGHANKERVKLHK